MEQVKLWKGFLEYERSNPQRLDATALTQRVELAYMQALMCLLHFPEVRVLSVGTFMPNIAMPAYLLACSCDGLFLCIVACCFI